MDIKSIFDFSIKKYREAMTSWQEEIKNAVTTTQELCRQLGDNLAERAEITEVNTHYPLRISPYYLGLVQQIGEPLYRQAVPDIRE
ncbi:MAG: hypothetical protein D3923_05235, partial [Candidatus Electrothrix sp. AR3]|nr:hypothetical protein [Candidatus Electrothrix sp. AR3]